MRISIHRVRVFAAVLLCGVTGLLQAQVNVTTYHNDNSRTGQNTQETTLTPSNVNSAQFGKLFSVVVDGAVYAQPLYLSAVTIAGGTHNVLYIVTEHDSVYAMDADSGTVYAQVSLIPSGGTTVNSSSDLGCGDLVPEVGITGTPVIDAVGGTLYVVAKSKVSGGIVQYLHALDTTSLAEKLNGPVQIQAQVPGTGYDASSGSVIFNAKQENQRAALLLENGHIVIGWSSHCDADPWHGWVMSYSASTLAQEAAFNTSPNGSRNGVWMSGSGPAADASGNIYFATGNGTWNGTSDYGDSIVKLGAPVSNAFPVVDYFTPYDQGGLSAGDEDVASGGLVLLPTLPSGKQLLAQQGKAGTIYLLNINNLGKYCINLTPACTNSDSQIVQEFFASPGIWGSPAYWNGNLYWTGANDSIKAYAFNANNSGLISTSPTSKSAQIFAFSAPTPAISANGNTNAILWALDGSADDSTCDGGGSSCLGLYAYDATNLTHLLYASSQAANNRDSPGTAVKFEKPIIANGKVYVGTQSSVTVYGLLGGPPPPAATPSFAPVAGSYGGPQSVTIADASPGATIYYTTNGTAPTTASSIYSGPITVSSSETVQALAAASGYGTSAVGSAAYTITASPPAATPTFAPAGGTYSGPQSVMIADASPGVTIYYTTNGTTPTTASAVYGSAIAVGSTETLQAIAAGNGYPSSAVGSAAYTISGSSTTVINDPAGFTSSAGLGFVGGASLTGGVLVLTNGGFSEARAVWNTTPVNVQSFTTDFNFQVTPATANIGDGFTFTLQNAAAGVKAIGGSGAGLGYQGMGSSVAVKFDLYSNAGEGSDSTGFYINGATPTLPAVDMTASGVNLHSGHVLHAHINYDGTTLTLTLTDTVTNASFTTSSAINIPATVGSSTAYVGFTAGTGGSISTQEILNWTYVVGSAPLVAATPTFAPAPGTYVGTQSVTIADASPGATIYYTTNGTTPTTASSIYSGPITVSSSETVQALAAASGYSTSAVGSAAYTITALPPAATPSFAPVAGTYVGTQSVTIADASPGATIYYTTNGTTPTTASPIYSGPITVSSSETVQALAAASGYSTSAVGSAAYTITALPPAATPSFAPVAGTYVGTQSVTIADATPGATIYYTTNGTAPTTASAVYGSAIAVGSSETLRAMAVASGYSNSAAGSAAYTITAPPPAATPSFAPAAGTYVGTQSVTIADATPGATIYYTTNGTAPTTASSIYSGPITVSSSETVQALAAASGYGTSAVGSAAYTITASPPAATPTFAPAGGTYSGPQSVMIADASPGVTIYYTTNGTTPTTASAVYGSAIAVGSTETLQAIAAGNGYPSSAVGSAAYTISGSSTTVINDPAGFTSSAGLGFVGGASLTGGVLVLTNGGFSEARAVWNTTPVNVQSFTTDFNFQVTPATANIGDGFTFTLQNAAAGVKAIGGSGAGLGYQGMGSSVAVKFDLYSNAGEGSDSTGFYINGATPTLPAVDMTASGVNLHSGHVLHAHINYDGTTLTLTLTDTVTNASFTTSSAINIPATVGSSTAYVGFTAGTGGSISTQEILNWTYVVN